MGENRSSDLSARGNRNFKRGAAACHTTAVGRDGADHRQADFVKCIDGDDEGRPAALLFMADRIARIDFDEVALTGWNHQTSRPRGGPT